MSEVAQVYKAIADVARSVGRVGISKNRSNKQQGYAFRGIDDIYNALSSALVDAGLCIIPRILSRECVERTSKSGTQQFYVVVHAEYDIVAVADGSKHTASAFGEAQDAGDKATNKAMSAAYKYMAMQLFCIPTDGDNDADATTPEEVVPSFDANRARASIRALPHYTPADETALEALTSREEATALYKAVQARGNGIPAR
jgi:hypothetical protein